MPLKTDVQYKEVPYQRYGHTAVSMGECAYIWGGRNDKDGACNVLFCFDTSKLELSAQPLNRRHCH